MMNVTSMDGTKHEMWMKPSHAAIDAYIPVYHEDMRWESLKLSLISVTNCYINVVCLYVFCVLVLKLKEVAPLGSFEPHRKFFQEDIKAYRDYNYLRRKSYANAEETGGTTADDLGGQILREWAVSTRNGCTRLSLINSTGHCRTGSQSIPFRHSSSSCNSVPHFT